jgi:hypothetical protein
MLKTKPQADPAAAAAEAMRAWALASARFADALATGWALWSRMLRPSLDRPFWLLVPGLPPASWARTCREEGRAAAPASGAVPAKSAFASYRSPGGTPLRRLSCPRGLDGTRRRQPPAGKTRLRVENFRLIRDDYMLFDE